MLVRQLDEQHYASDSHSRMLGLAAMKLLEVEKLTEVIDKEGYSYETTGTTGQTMIKARPEVILRSEATRHAQSLLAEFGLSAASVSKVKVPKKEKDSKWGDFGA
jgi:P27 family predicted phage terminase small subunit